MRAMASPFIDILEAALPLLLSSLAIFTSMGAVVDFLRWLKPKPKPDYFGGDDIGGDDFDDGIEDRVVHNRRITHDSHWSQERRRKSEAATVERQDYELLKTPRRQIRIPKPRRGKAPFLALVLVAIVFAISLGVLWSLMHMGGPIEATVNA